MALLCFDPELEQVDFDPHTPDLTCLPSDDICSAPRQRTGWMSWFGHLRSPIVLMTWCGSVLKRKVTNFLQFGHATRLACRGAIIVRHPFSHLCMLRSKTVFVARKAQTTKNLEKPWADLCVSRTDNEQSNRHSARSTLLLDDSPLKARLQPYNHVCLPEYDGRRRTHDVALATYLNAVDVLRGENGTRSPECSPIEPLSKDVKGNPDEENLKKRKGRSPSFEAVGCPDPIGSSIGSPSDSDTHPLKHMKKRKKKQLRTLHESVDQHACPEGKFDDTLLAVIGILDAAMMQSNIAGWIMDGGLWAMRANGSTPLATESNLHDDRHADPPSSSPLGDSGRPEVDVPQHSAGAAGNDRETLAASSDPVQAELNAEPAPPPMWFEDKANMSYWIDRGRGALRDLNIEEEPGVRV